DTSEESSIEPSVEASDIFAEIADDLDDGGASNDVQELMAEMDAINDELIEDLGELDDLVADLETEPSPSDEAMKNAEGLEDSVASDDSEIESQSDPVDETPDEPIEDPTEEAIEDAIADAVADIANDLADEADQDSASETTEEAENDPVDEAVEEPLDETVETAEAAEADEAVETVDPEPVNDEAGDELESLGDLDAALADIGDELLGDFETPDGEMIDSDTLDDTIDPSLLLDQLDLETPKETSVEKPGDASVDSVPDPTADETTDETEDHPAEESSEAESTAVSSAEPDETPTPESTAKSAPPAQEPAPAASTEPETKAPVLAPEEHVFVHTEKDPDHVESVWQMLWRVTNTHARTAAITAKEKGTPLGAKILLILSGPVADKPAKVRDSIGWLALWTIFLALTLWVYLVFVRTSPTPTPIKAPTRVVMPGESLEPIENQLHSETP
ncbi:MAG: hypothetical protein ACWA5W_03660, partial [Phycisphaerales bacterium]